MAIRSLTPELMNLGEECGVFVNEVEAGEHPDADPEVVELARRISELNWLMFDTSQKGLAAITGTRLGQIPYEEGVREQEQAWAEYQSRQREMIDLAAKLSEHTP